MTPSFEEPMDGLFDSESLVMDMNLGSRRSWENGGWFKPEDPLFLATGDASLSKSLSKLKGLPLISTKMKEMLKILKLEANRIPSRTKLTKRKCNKEEWEL